MKNLPFLIVAFIIQIQVTAQSCLPNGIFFYSQETIDNFPSDYPGCTEIEGYVWISGTNITNVDSLHVLTSIGGYLEFDTSDPSLNLNGLANLTSIGEDLSFYSNGISSLTGLDNLLSIGRDLIIYECYELTSLTGLGNLTSVGRDVTIMRSNLTNLSSLENLSSVGRDFYLTFTSLTNLSGMENLTSIGGNFEIKSNYVLLNLSGLSSLSTIGGDLILSPYSNNYQGNQSLMNLSGLNNLVSVDGNIEMKENNALIDLSGLDGLKKINGKLWLEDNTALTSLTGLTNLDTVYSGLYLINNGNMTSISALQNVSVIRGYIWIQYSPKLKSLSGLVNINHNQIYNIILTNNDSLCTCEVESICSFLAQPGSLATVMYNDSGCNSRAEIEVACESADISDYDDGSDFILSPNPASNHVFFSSKYGVPIDEIVIYNEFSQKALSKRKISLEIDISMLAPGLYFIEMVTDNGMIRRKLIIR